MSATWNCDTPDDAAGKDADDATVHDWDVPGEGASVPPEVTVVDAWLAKTSVTCHAASSRDGPGNR